MNPRLIVAVAALSLSAVLAGTAAWVSFHGKGDAFASCGASQVAGSAIGGHFTLVDQTGATVTDADIIKQPTLVYFGYTFCPDVCPLDNARNAEVVAALDKRGIDVTPVFISVDPKRDTPEVMAAYVENFSPKMIGLTGSAAQVADAARAYHVYYKAHDETDPNYYAVDHSAFTYLMLPGHGFADFFTRDDTAAQIEERVACDIAAVS
ncbi:MAG: SCO family protein [Limimaricola sp.]|uniref:SCO family protein n=1 Tax=Limimaricola sp. TaxID=2211665 RepID=UPI001DF84635|nr:SCO family protein [Limimaricola sp.]MBI1417241.1 SCO family protein [Limimaricola sp.]